MTAVEYRAAIESGIAEWFEVQKSSAPSQEAELLVDRMGSLIQRGGKRARPELLYITYTAYGGKDPARIIDLGIGLEFLHQFLLIHDDIMDQDTERYGGLNIMGLYAQDLPDNQEIAASIALLAGDLLFSYSNQVILGSQTISAEQKVELLREINLKDGDVAFGQQLDTVNIVGLVPDFTEERLLQTHLLKTASYTVKLPMVCAATVLGLPATERKKIIRFSERFGLLFQLADDYSDYFDNGSDFTSRRSRPKFRDFPQSKLTHPLHMGLQLADSKQMEVIRKNLGNKHLTDEQMAQVIQVLVDCGAQEASRKLVAKHFDQTLEALDTLSLGVQQKQLFHAMVKKYQI